MTNIKSALRTTVDQLLNDEIKYSLTEGLNWDDAAIALAFIDLALRQPIYFIHLAAIIMGEDNRPNNIKLVYPSDEWEYCYLNDNCLQLGLIGGEPKDYTIDYTIDIPEHLKRLSRDLGYEDID